MENIKESFRRVKEDMDLLRDEINFLKSDLLDTRERMVEICEIIEKINKKIYENNSLNIQTNPTNRQKNNFQNNNSSTYNYNINPLKHQNLPISIGNRGVPTDKQTNRQTDKQTKNQDEVTENSIEEAFEILNSLDTIKKEIRLKFKRLTNQEFLVFSTLYQIEEESGYSDYKLISQKLNLSESSIRDYIGRLLKKGIPIDKIKVNNKNIQLSISKNFKKMATLQTILQLRDI